MNAVEVEHIILQEEAEVDPKRKIGVDHQSLPQDDIQAPTQGRVKERENMNVIGRLIIGLQNIITTIEIIEIEIEKGKGTMIEIGKETIEEMTAEGTEIEYRNSSAKN